MRLGISSYTYTWAIGVAGHPPQQPLSALGLLDKAVKLGVRLVQVCDNLPLDRLSAAELAAFERRAQELGIGIEVGTRGIALNHLRRYLGLAQRFKSSILRVVVDTATHHPSEAEVLQAVRAILPELERAGVCLAIENHDRFTAKTLADIIKRCNTPPEVGSPYVGICLDTANSFAALEGPQVVVETLAPWAVNLHIKDFVVQRVPSMMGFTIEGRPMGQGRLDVPWLLQTLRAAGRDPNAILELWTTPQETLAATIAREDAAATASIAYLRTLIAD